jgi:hypothetical protein
MLDEAAWQRGCGAAMLRPFPGDELPGPSQNRVGCDDRRDPRQHPTTQPFAEGGQPSGHDPSTADADGAAAPSGRGSLRASDDLVLFVLEPAEEGRDEELHWNHGAESTPTAGRSFRTLRDQLERRVVETRLTVGANPAARSSACCSLRVPPTHRPTAGTISRLGSRENRSAEVKRSTHVCEGELTHLPSSPPVPKRRTDRSVPAAVGSERRHAPLSTGPASPQLPGR